LGASGVGEGGRDGYAKLVEDCGAEFREVRVLAVPEDVVE
jgi:hypothetical protein